MNTGSGVAQRSARLAHNQEDAGSSPATAPSLLVAYMTENEASAYLRVAANTLRGWRVSGKGPRFRLHGNRVVYATIDLDTWSDGRAKLSTSDAPTAASSTTEPIEAT